MNNRKFILSALCFGIIALTGCGNVDTENEQAANVVSEKVDKSVVFDGTVTARDEKVIFAKESGTIKDILFKEGDKVKNETVINYTIPDLTQEPQAEGEQSENPDDEKEEKVKIKDIKCDFSDAIITAINVEEGQSVMEGTSLIKLAKGGDYYISSEVLENFIDDISLDSAVTIIPNSDKTKSFSGKITKIYPMAYQNENGDNVVKVEVTFDKQDESPSLGYTVKIKAE